jgi:hypothetical protein
MKLFLIVSIMFTSAYGFSAQKLSERVPIQLNADGNTRQIPRYYGCEFQRSFTGSELDCSILADSKQVPFYFFAVNTICPQGGTFSMDKAREYFQKNCRLVSACYTCK